MVLERNRAMGPADPALRPGTRPEAYLAAERASEAKHELWSGEVFAMAGASFAHHQIVTNLARELSGRLRDRACDVLRAGRITALDGPPAQPSARRAHRGRLQHDDLRGSAPILGLFRTLSVQYVLDRGAGLGAHAVPSHYARSTAERDGE